MPIHRTIELNHLSKQEFADIDRVVMGCAFACQNHFGRFFDEKVYENDMAARLKAEGFTVYTQVPIKVTHQGFEKNYLLDLIVNDMVYELKVVSALVGEHDAQALNYAMLQNVCFIKILNFGEPKVHGRLLRNAVAEPDRRHSKTEARDWYPLGTCCEKLMESLKALINDWGTHLDSKLYNEALIYFWGGDANCLRRTELTDALGHLGTHTVQHHDERLVFVLTSFTREQPVYRRHLQILLQHARDLDGIQWLNLNHAALELKTVVRQVTDGQCLTS